MRRYLVRLAAALLLLLLSAPLAAASSPQVRLRKTLARSLRSAGGASGAYVVDLSTGRTLFSSFSRTPRLPASVEKLYTTSTALLRFGPDATLTTSVLGVGSFGSGGAFNGTLYLRGGGDPTFGSASFDRYEYGTGATMQQLVADLIQATGITSLDGAIVGDESDFDSLRGTPATGYQANAYVEGSLSALAYDRGFTEQAGSSFQSRPAHAAAQHFASALRAAGVAVPGTTRVSAGRTPLGAQVLTSMESPPMAMLAQLTNAPSDNFLAEMLLKGIGAGFGGAGTTAAGAAVVRSQMAASFGIHPQLDDGSGLSRDDSTSPRQVVRLLTAMATNAAFTASLAVAGESGTMRDEMVGTRAQGRCRGKTGTLHDVANLVGYCAARDRHRLAFAFLMNAVDPAIGHSIEDQMGVALAKYNG